MREQPIQVIASRAEKQACRAFPEPQGDGLKRGTSRSSQTGAMLIQRVYEIDPLCCPKCRAERSPSSSRRRDREDPPPCGSGTSGTAGRPRFVHDAARAQPGGRDEPRELTCVDEDTFWSEF